MLHQDGWSAVSTADRDALIATFLAKYSAAMAAELADAQARLRAFFLRGFERVFDNYNALVFAASA